MMAEAHEQTDQEIRAGVVAKGDLLLRIIDALFDALGTVTSIEGSEVWLLTNDGRIPLRGARRDEFGGHIDDAMRATVLLGKVEDGHARTVPAHNVEENL